METNHFTQLSEYLEMDLSVVQIHYVVNRTMLPGEFSETGPRVTNCLYFVSKGELTVSMQHTKFTVGSSQFVSFNVGDKYRVENCSENPAKLYLVAFLFYMRKPLRSAYIPLFGSVENEEKFNILFQNLLEQYHLRMVGYKIKMYSLLDNIIYHLLCHLAMNTENHTEYNEMIKIVNYINQNYDKRIAVESLCSICHFSPAHFRRLFLKHFGMSPLKYINKLRIEKAKELLAVEQCSVTECCERVGFTDISHFSTTFKKYVGISPYHYKKIL